MHKVISIRMLEETHAKLKLLSLVRRKPMGDIIDDLIGGAILPQTVSEILSPGSAPVAPPAPQKQMNGNKAKKKKRGF